MLVIRLARTGKKHQAYFRIVVADSKRAVTAKFIEILGNYDPHAKKLAVNKEQLEKYLKNGAQPSEAVAKLLIREKIELPKWVKVTEKKKAPKREPEVKPAPAEEPKATEAETPEVVEEAVTETEEVSQETPVEETVSTEAEQAEEAAPAEESAPEAAPEGGELDESKELDSSEVENDSNKTEEVEASEEEK